MQMKKSMGETVWREKEKLALDYLKERLPVVPAEQASDAWWGGGDGVPLINRGLSRIILSSSVGKVLKWRKANNDAPFQTIFFTAPQFFLGAEKAQEKAFGDSPLG